MDRRAMILDALQCYAELGRAYRDFNSQSRSRDSLGMDTEELIYSARYGSFIGSLKNLVPSIEDSRANQKRIEKALDRREPLLPLFRDLLQHKTVKKVAKRTTQRNSSDNGLSRAYEELGELYVTSEADPRMLSEYEGKRSLFFLEVRTKFGDCIFENYRSHQLLDACLDRGKPLLAFLRAITRKV